MELYGDIIRTLGDSLSSYNSIGWVDFKNQMMVEINGCRINTPTREWESESILSYNIDEIQKSNILTRNNARFTYYTQDGPKGSINSKPILADPNLNLRDAEYNTKFFEGESDNLSRRGYFGSAVFEKEYAEDSVVRSSSEEMNEPLDKAFYDIVSPKYKNTLLGKTKEWFKNESTDYISKRYATLISRFHSELNQTPLSELNDSVGLQAGSNKYGLSHGRNLLKLQPDESYGYDNPYCRVWKWHHQYSALVRDTIRPFGIEDNSQTTLEKTYNWSTFRNGESYGFGSGGYRLEKYGVMYNDGGKTTGLVNITPSTENGQIDVSVEKCMFSIENLAWKGMFNDRDSFDENGLSPEQKGPLGGRIMWFPPYDIKFNESTSANWQSNEFIGRGEPIYTYANTTRSGTLSFKLLIDHPSILDYWERRNGKPGSVASSGVDDVDSNEQTMLRFFAGCDILAANANPSQGDDNKKDKEEPKKEDPIEEATTEEGEEFNFFVFFPNNYSGVNDEIGGFVDPVDYLMNGVGTQEYITDDSIDEYYETTEIATSPTTEYSYDGKAVGGYEIRSDVGVSLVEEETYANKICVVESNEGDYELGKLVGRKASSHLDCAYVYDSKDKKTVKAIIDFEDDDYQLNQGDMKVLDGVTGEVVVYGYYTRPDVGEGYCQTMAQNYANSVASYLGNRGIEVTETTGFASMPFEFNKRRYYYRADRDTLNQVLIGDKDNGAVSYIDKVSYQLNSVGYGVACDRFGVDKSKTYSMADVYVALNGNKTYPFSEFTDQERVATLMEIFEGKRGAINEIIFRGSASSQANNASKETNTKRNESLAKRRSNTILKWMSSNTKTKWKYDTSQTFEVDDDKTYNQADSNEKEAKLTRFVLVTVKYGGPVVEDGGKTQIQISESGSVENNSVVRTGETTEAHIPQNPKPQSKVKVQETNVRYDNEALFFKRLKENEPFITKLLSERIKNFDPVFHSMSPEGFNARLTFLNQCMRQGPTYSAYDSGEKNPSNLAFGRPPVCVLRVGDFYNTKIVITTMNIDYDPLVWDLNHEGIGVMPMIANISLNFNFIGGSDLGGPIQRLQNAASFNYYANAGVYDNRAEMIEYKNTNPVGFKSFDPYKE